MQRSMDVMKVFVIFLNLTFGRFWKIFVINIPRLLWYDGVVPSWHYIVLLSKPHASIQYWSHYRRVFCVLWLQLIRSEVVQALEGLDWGTVEAKDMNAIVRAAHLSVVLKGKCVLTGKTEESHPVRRRVIFRSGRALNEAAQKTRQRLSGELNSISIVAVLLAAANLAALVTGGDAFLDNTYRVTATAVVANPGSFQTVAMQGMGDTGGYDGCGKKFPFPTILKMFIACVSLALLFSVLLTGMFARISTLLNLCPDRKALVWFLWRYEPTIGLMHLLLVLTLLFTSLAAGSYSWALSCRHLEPFAKASAVVAGTCLLYFLYFHANSYFSWTHGLARIVSWKPIYSIADEGIAVPTDLKLSKNEDWRSFTNQFCFCVKRRRGCWRSTQSDIDSTHHSYPIMLDSALRSILELEFMNILSEEPFAVWKREITFLDNCVDGMAQYDMRHACPGQTLNPLNDPPHPEFTCLSRDNWLPRRSMSVGSDPIVHWELSSCYQRARQAAALLATVVAAAEISTTNDPGGQAKQKTALALKLIAQRRYLQRLAQGKALCEAEQEIRRMELQQQPGHISPDELLQLANGLVQGGWCCWIDKETINKVIYSIQNLPAPWNENAEEWGTMFKEFQGSWSKEDITESITKHVQEIIPIFEQKLGNVAAQTEWAKTMGEALKAAKKTVNRIAPEGDVVQATALLTTLLAVVELRQQGFAADLAIQKTTEALTLVDERWHLKRVRLRTIAEAVDEIKELHPVPQRALGLLACARNVIKHRGRKQIYAAYESIHASIQHHDHVVVKTRCTKLLEELDPPQLHCTDQDIAECMAKMAREIVSHYQQLPAVTTTVDRIAPDDDVVQATALLTVLFAAVELREQGVAAHLAKVKTTEVLKLVTERWHLKSTRLRKIAEAVNEIGRLNQIPQRALGLLACAQNVIRDRGRVQIDAALESIKGCIKQLCDDASWGEAAARCNMCLAGLDTPHNYHTDQNIAVCMAEMAQEIIVVFDDSNTTVE